MSGQMDLSRGAVANHLIERIRLSNHRIGDLIHQIEIPSRHLREKLLIRAISQGYFHRALMVYRNETN